MKKVIIRAPLLTYSGYGTHSRQIFRWLLSRNDIDITAHCVPWGITPWMLHPDLENGLVEEIMKRASPPPPESDVSIQIQLPNEWDPNLAKFNIGVSAFVETDRCNPEWINHCNKMDLIIVPSTFIKDVINNTGKCMTPIHVVPESYHDSISSNTSELLKLELDTSFNFLLFGQFTGNSPVTDRKNLFNTIKWICEEFQNEPDVGIILKTNSGKNTTIDRKLTTKIVRQLLAEIRPGSFPKLHLLHGVLSPNEIASLYVDPKVKALVSLTRGEGYGLPILEAASSGVPVIVTAWSGHLDFLGNGKFIPVNYNLQPLHSSRIDGQIFMENAKWAEPDEKNAKQRLRKFYKSPNIPKKWALDLQKILLEKYSQSAINTICDDILGVHV